MFHGEVARLSGHFPAEAANRIRWRVSLMNGSRDNAGRGHCVGVAAREFLWRVFTTPRPAPPVETGKQ